MTYGEAIPRETRRLGWLSSIRGCASLVPGSANATARFT